jgi:RNA polymerase sigma factor (sigma-70 family)
VRDKLEAMDFSALYREHAAPLTAYFLRRTGDPETAADLTAETFAAALAGVRRFDPSRGPAVGWLYGIARHQLAMAQRRGRVETRARRRLGMERLEPTPAALEKLVELAQQESTARALDAALEALPPEQRDAVTARVLHGEAYTCPAARQRVSRGLARMRARLNKEELS